MNPVLINRVQSAYSRPSYRSGEDTPVKTRPMTSRSRQQSYTSDFEEVPIRTGKSSVASHHRRSRTAGSSAATSAKSTSRKLRSDEIETLLQSLDRDDTVIFHIDCLADYRTLVQTIDLRKTPIDCQLLRALQQRENRIVQRNACHDVRFRSLIELLQPTYIPGEIEENTFEEDTLDLEAGNPHNSIPVESLK